MEYTILKVNDDNSATVAMTVNEHTLNQDVDLGTSQADFTTNVEGAMAVFKSELDRNGVTTPTFTPQLDTPVTVSSLPTIPPADLEPLVPAPTVEQIDTTPVDANTPTAT